MLSDYFKEVEEESIRDNFVICYELLDEMVDFGYPQTTDAKILQEYITQVRVENSRMLIYRGRKMYIPMFSRRVTSSRPRPSRRPQ